jgi:ribosomal-protein-alanine N-acetyltransferase
LRERKEEEVNMIELLETARLRLRPFQLDDASALFAYACDPEIARLGMWSPLTTLEECHEEIVEMIEGYRRGGQWSWAIEIKEDQTMIGRCDLLKYRQQHRNAEIGYALARHAWGKGYATEAIHALIRFAFSQLALHRLEALVFPFNMASLRVLEKVGMQREGIKRQAYFLETHFVDLFSYGLLAEDYQGGNKQGEQSS